MKTIALLLAIALVLLLRVNTFAQTADTSEKIRQVEKGLVGNIMQDTDTPWTIKERMAHYNIQGVSIAVIRNYKLEWAKGYGWADAGLKIPVTTQTLFQAGSISKSLNSVGVLKLAQDKKLDLYTDINVYLKSWEFPYDSLSKGKKITIANLLSHSAGLTVHGFGGYEKGQPIPTVVEVLEGKKPANSPAIKSLFEPGLRFQYSGGGTTISQLIVMDVTGEPYAQYMYKHVLKPLGMSSSTYEQPPLNVNPAQLSAGYFPNGKEVPGKYHIYPEQAAAGLWTNPTNLAKYIIETQLAYAGKSNKVLNHQTTVLRLTPYIEKTAAMGVFISDYDGVKYFSHDGSDVGFLSQYYGSFEGGNGLVIMVNTSNGDKLIPEIVNSIAKVYGFTGLYHSRTVKRTVVADSVLQSYTGQYQIEPGFTVTISREGNILWGQGTGQGKIQFVPEAQNKFYFKMMPDIEVEFVKDDKGAITKLILYQNGKHVAPKIK